MKTKQQSYLKKYSRTKEENVPNSVRYVTVTYRIFFEISTNTSLFQYCVNNDGSYDCECRDGFDWNVEKTDCIDIDECNPKLVANHDLCDSNSLCVNTIGSYKCSCNLGFYWSEASNKCEDYNECDADRKEWTMEGAVCPAEQIFDYAEIKDKCAQDNMVPLTVRTKSQADAYMSSSCANFIKDNGATLEGHWLGFSKGGRRQWTDVFENAVYQQDLEAFMEFGDPANQHCVVSWHQYVNNLSWIGGDYPCSFNKIGYVCIKPWADALANPDPFEFSDHKISLSDFTEIETNCREKGLYPMSLTDNIDISKFLHVYNSTHGKHISKDYDKFWLLKQDGAVYKDWVGRISDVEDGQRHGINNGIQDPSGTGGTYCLAAWDHHTYDTDDQGCDNKYYACAQNTQPYSSRSEYNAQVLEWLGNPGNNCAQMASCSNNVGSFVCTCQTGWEDRDPDCKGNCKGTDCIDMNECLDENDKTKPSEKVFKDFDPPGLCTKLSQVSFFDVSK